MGDVVEALKASMHGDGSWWPCIFGAAPGSEAGDDPGGPGQRSGREGISQPRGFAVEGGGDGFEDGDVLRVESGGGRPTVGAVPGANELHAGDGGPQGNDGELSQSGRGFDLAFFEAEALALAGSEELLDVPAATIVSDGLMGLGQGLDRRAGEQAPMYGLDAWRRVDLAHIEGVEGELVGQMTIGAVAGTAQGEEIEAQGHGGAPGGAARNGRQVEVKVIAHRQIVEVSEQITLIGQAAVGLGPHQQFDLGRALGESGIDVTLAVGDHGDGGGARHPQERRGLRPDQPTLRFLVDRLAATLAWRRLVAFPDLHISQAQHDAAVRVDHQHGMDEEGPIRAVAAVAEGRFTAWLLREVDLARILDRQDAPPGHLGQQMRPRRANQSRFAHPLVVQKAMERLLARLVLCKPLDRNRSAHDKALEKLAPLLRSRSSPKYPRSSATTAASCPKTAAYGIRDSLPPPHTFAQPSQFDASLCPQRCVRAVALAGAGWGGGWE